MMVLCRRGRVGIKERGTPAVPPYPIASLCRVNIQVRKHSGVIGGENFKVLRKVQKKWRWCLEVSSYVRHFLVRFVEIARPSCFICAGGSSSDERGRGAGDGGFDGGIVRSLQVSKYLPRLGSLSCEQMRSEQCKIDKIQLDKKLIEQKPIQQSAK